MLAFVKNFFVGKQNGGRAARLNGNRELHIESLENRELLSVSPIYHCTDVSAYVGRHGEDADPRVFNGKIFEVAICEAAAEDTDNNTDTIEIKDVITDAIRMHTMPQVIFGFIGQDLFGYTP